MNRLLVAYTVLAAISGVLHLLWERTHIQLYTGYEVLEGALPVYVFATLGDIAYTLGVVLVLGLIVGSFAWFLRAGARVYVGLAVVGFWIALFVEYKALAFDRWEYTEAMPLFLQVGVSPLLQMAILLPFSVYLTRVALGTKGRTIDL